MSLPGRGPPGLMSRLYAIVEKFMPWKYTGIYSSPEFKSHVPVIHEWRTSAPTNPAFVPVVPAVRNEDVFETKRYKGVAKRAKLLADVELTDADIKRMYTWQKSTPLGGARFRWEKVRQHVQDYDDNGYT